MFAEENERQELAERDNAAAKFMGEDSIHSNAGMRDELMNIEDDSTDSASCDTFDTDAETRREIEDFHRGIDDPSSSATRSPLQRLVGFQKHRVPRLPQETDHESESSSYSEAGMQVHGRRRSHD